MLFLLCGKRNEQENKGLESISENIWSTWFRSESEEKLILAANIPLTYSINSCLDCKILFISSTADLASVRDKTRSSEWKKIK